MADAAEADMACNPPMPLNSASESASVRPELHHRSNVLAKAQHKRLS